MMEVNRSDWRPSHLTDNWQAIDSTVHTPVLATMREEKPGVTIESRRVLPHMELCDVNLFTTDTLLRYKSEWDPRQHAHTKGGYLEGEIRVPKVISICKRYVLTCPCLGSSKPDIAYDIGDISC